MPPASSFYLLDRNRNMKKLNFINLSIGTIIELSRFNARATDLARKSSERALWKRQYLGFK